ANSTGAPAELIAVGSAAASAGLLELRASGLPSSAVALPIVSRGTALVPMVGGSAGTLCLGGAIGRFDLVQAGLGGALSLPVDLGALPRPNGTAPALAGETWVLQLWYRDAAANTSNLTNASSVAFR
ncbi:MAG: hypothetical protein AAGD01_20955, partial [Acidobacteriota bacterium]